MRLLEITHVSIASLGLEPDADGNLYCSDKKLTSLEGAPSSVGGNFSCSNNKLTSLQGTPSSVGGDFFCSNNQLTSLQGTPVSVGGYFFCDNNKLTSLQGAPSSVGGSFSCSFNRLTSLADVHKHIKKIKGVFYAIGNKLTRITSLLLIEGLTRIVIDNKEAEEIMNSHFPSRGMIDVLEAQQELVDAGLEEMA